MSVNTNEWQKSHPWEPSPAAHPQPVPLVKPSDLFNPMLTIADVMKREAPTCPPDASVAEAAVSRKIGGGMGGVREDEQQYDMGAEI